MDYKKSGASQQEAVLTVWKDGTYKIWSAMDAHYSQSDPEYLVTIPYRIIEADVERQLAAA